MSRPALLLGATLALAACATPRGPMPRLPAQPDTLQPLPVQPLPDPAAMIVTSATAMLGQPYRFGGAAPGGFDCSGLVVYATSSAGVRLPRTAQEQLRSGSAIARHQLQAGDLVFMHLKRKELHVGIAIDRDRFVHAPSTGGYVRIDSLTETAYARGFLSARRVIAGPAPRTP